ncbi:MAG: hypothetical protein GWP41_06485 [Planctomycetia bacterium]|nr:hypothetical protein [Planctomycetia bacterium]NCF98937.1 hypothetical protein [Planctomycetia bacterium]NCG12902.1 hypothetical protein [Planctomycetia bacterium]
MSKSHPAKIFLAVIVGLIVGMACNLALVEVNFIFYPPPADLSMGDTEGFRQYMSTLPLTAYFIPILAHLSQAFVGAFVAARICISQPLLPAMIVGSLSLLGGIINALILPVPIWMWAEMPFYLILSRYAAKLIMQRQPAQAPHEGLED